MRMSENYCSSNNKSKINNNNNHNNNNNNSVNKNSDGPLARYGRRKEGAQYLII